jgi:hypothetical protein
MRGLQTAHPFLLGGHCRRAVDPPGESDRGGTNPRQAAAGPAIPIPQDRHAGNTSGSTLEIGNVQRFRGFLRLWAGRYASLRRGSM